MMIKQGWVTLKNNLGNGREIDVVMSWEGFSKMVAFKSVEQGWGSMTVFEKSYLLQSKEQEEDKLGLFEEKKQCQCS